MKELRLSSASTGDSSSPTNGFADLLLWNAELLLQPRRQWVSEAKLYRDRFLAMPFQEVDFTTVIEGRPSSLGSFRIAADE
jgi:hypothetical protein